MNDSMRYQICINCVMDTSDPNIVFDENGVCDHCIDFERHVQPGWHPDEQGRKQLDEIVLQIKAAGQGRDFDCLTGLSGGVDSSYMLHLMVTEYGLRPLVFHVDAGWNSELAVHNINVLIDKLGLDLYTEVINWEEMRNFHLALLKSGVPHIDLAQDPDVIATRLASGICPIIHSSVLARTDLLRSLGGYRVGFLHAEDYDLWLRVLHASKIVVLPEPLLYYRSSVDGIRFTRVAEATVSRAYALDCYQRRCNGQPELARAQFVAGYDPSKRTVETLWSMALEALMLERRDIASTLTGEILRREPSHRMAHLLMSLLDSPIAGGTALTYQSYRKARGWLGSTTIGPMLSNLKHRSPQQAREV